MFMSVEEIPNLFSNFIGNIRLFEELKTLIWILFFLCLKKQCFNSHGIVLRIE